MNNFSSFIIPLGVPCGFTQSYLYPLWLVIDHTNWNVVGISTLIWALQLKKIQNYKWNNITTCCDVNLKCFFSPHPRDHHICIVENVMVWPIQHYNFKFYSSWCSFQNLLNYAILLFWNPYPPPCWLKLLHILCN